MLWEWGRACNPDECADGMQRTAVIDCAAHVESACDARAAQLCPIMQDSELACAGEDDVTDNGPPTKRRKLAATSSKLTVDSECGYAGRVVLTADGCDAYSCTLNQYSLANKFNKYYLMQLLKVIRYPELNRLTRQLPVCN